MRLRRAMDAAHLEAGEMERVYRANRERAGIPLVSSQKGEFFCSKAVGVAGR